MNIDIVKMIHNSILLPHIDYACVIWDRCPNEVNVDRICNRQKRAAQVMLRCKIQDISSSEIFKRINRMPFQDRVSYTCCLMMFKVKNNLVPSYIQTITPVLVVHDHNTRSAAGDFYVSCPNLKYYTRSFQCEGTRLWNNIRGSIHQSTSIPVFKSRDMKKYFTQ